MRPESYIEITNFYTATVYNKGAELIRMMRTILGPEKFRAGTDLYFERHDGQAVTCEDFVRAMEDASGVDLTQFRLWYSQAGTPKVKAEMGADGTLRLAQHVPPTPGQPDEAAAADPAVAGLVRGGERRGRSPRSWSCSTRRRGSCASTWTGSGRCSRSTAASRRR